MIDFQIDAHFMGPLQLIVAEILLGAAVLHFHVYAHLTAAGKTVYSFLAFERIKP